MGRMGNVSEEIGELMGETYQIKNDTDIAEPKWTTLTDKWGTEIEKEEINYAYKRNALQKEVGKGERDLLKQQKNMQKRESILAFKETTEYIRNNKEKIRYSKNTNH